MKDPAMLCRQTMLNPLQSPLVPSSLTTDPAKSRNVLVQFLVILLLLTDSRGQQTMAAKRVDRQANPHFISVLSEYGLRAAQAPLNEPRNRAVDTSEFEKPLQKKSFPFLSMVCRIMEKTDWPFPMVLLTRRRSVSKGQRTVVAAQPPITPVMQLNPACCGNCLWRFVLTKKLIDSLGQNRHMLSPLPFQKHRIPSF